MSTTEHSATGLPLGQWQVEAKDSRLAFSVKTFWGLLPVKGTFSEFSGELKVDATTASGTLIIQTASLDTKNAKRDTHLRGTDFFDAEKHPTIVFTLAGAESAHGHVHLDGTLALPGGSVPLTLHTDAETGDRLELHTGTEISRAAAGLTWNQAGMIKDTVLLIADVTLIPA